MRSSLRTTRSVLRAEETFTHLPTTANNTHHQRRQRPYVVGPWSRTMPVVERCKGETKRRVGVYCKAGSESGSRGRERAKKKNPATPPSPPCAAAPFALRLFAPRHRRRRHNSPLVSPITPTKTPHACKSRKPPPQIQIQNPIPNPKHPPTSTSTSTSAFPFARHPSPFPRHPSRAAPVPARRPSASGQRRARENVTWNSMTAWHERHGSAAPRIALAPRRAHPQVRDKRRRACPEI